MKLSIEYGQGGQDGGYNRGGYNDGGHNLGGYNYGNSDYNKPQKSGRGFDPNMNMGGGSNGAIILIAIVFIIAILPYALAALVISWVVYALLKFFKKSVPYKRVYIAVFLSSVFSLLVTALIFFGLFQFIEQFHLKDSLGFIISSYAILILLIIFITIYAFYKLINMNDKILKYSSAFLYTLCIIIPLNIFFQLLPLIIYVAYFFKDYGLKNYLPKSIPFLH